LRCGWRAGVVVVVVVVGFGLLPIQRELFNLSSSQDFTDSERLLTGLITVAPSSVDIDRDELAIEQVIVDTEEQIDMLDIFKSSMDGG
jgi:hypothetical protein